MTVSYLLAAQNGDWQTMEPYLDIDENVKYSVDETTKKTAVVIVIENNHIEVLRAMLHRKVAVSYVPAPHRESPWSNQSDCTRSLGDHAARLGNIDTIKALAAVDGGLFNTWRTDNILVVAVRHNRRDLIEWLIDFGRMAPGRNLLLVPFNSGHLPLARWLLSTGRAGIDDFVVVMRSTSLLDGWRQFCWGSRTAHRGQRWIGNHAVVEEELWEGIDMG
jgi:hypothetical protein